MFIFQVISIAQANIPMDNPLEYFKVVVYAHAASTYQIPQDTAVPSSNSDEPAIVEALMECIEDTRIQRRGIC